MTSVAAMKHILYGMHYVLRHHLLGKRAPLICGLTLTNRCNLRCKHCRIPSRGARDMSREEVRNVIDAYYDQGGRCLYLQGGEPFLWQDGEYGIEDIVKYAHDKVLTYQLAERHGIPIPKTYYPHCTEELEQLETEFPVIIKPSTKVPFYNITKKKAVQVENRNELVDE